MRNGLFRKGLVFSLIFLFIGASVVPGIYGEFWKLDNTIYKQKSEIFKPRGPSFDEPPYEQWNRTFSRSDFDCARSVNQTTDSGFIITGETNSFESGNSDVWLIKTNSNGIEQWNRTFGGSNSDSGKSVFQTADGGYIIAGITCSYGMDDVWLIKTDSNGIEQWNRTFGGQDSDFGNSVCLTSDGGYIIAGGTRSYGNSYCNVWLIKTDSNGEEIWNKTYIGSGEGQGYSVQQTRDSGYIIAADNWFSNKNQFWLIKTDSDGIEQWNNTFEKGEHLFIYSIQQTLDDGFICLGIIYKSSENTDFLLIKTDVNGIEQWNKTYGGIYPDNAYSVDVTLDGGYIMTGGTASFGFNYNAWLIKTDSGGIEQWNKTFGIIGGECEGESVQQTSDGGYIIAGAIASYEPELDADVWLLKVYSDMSPNFIYVDDNYDSSTPGWDYDHFSSIQAGIDAVDVGGTVFVYSGVYHENVVIAHDNIHLVGENNNTTIIDANGIGNALYIAYHNNNQISNFTIRNAGEQGVYIFASSSTHSWLSQNNTIKNCIITGNSGNGVYIHPTGYGCRIHDTKIVQCEISENGGNGIYLHAQGNHCSMGYSTNITWIIDCIIKNNSVDGIRMFAEDYHSFISFTRVMNNTITRNSGYGINVILTPDCWNDNHLIYHNNFIDNGQNALDALDPSVSMNKWYNETLLEGNYWSDYNGVDNNNDGIGDTPYNISGGSNQDLYPFMQSNGWLNEPPIANFTYTINDKTVSYNASSSFDNNGFITDYLWQFGDGTNGTGVLVNHIYPDYETYTISLTVIDNKGSNNTTTLYVSLDDLIPPEIWNVQDHPDPQHIGKPVNISCLVTDNDAISDVKVHITYPDSSAVNQTMYYNLITNAAYFNSTYSMEGTYSYFIWVNDTSGNTNSSSIYFFEIFNNPPNPPSNPSPADGSTGIDTTVILLWTGSDPDQGDMVTYDVYFGTSTNPPQVGFNQSITSYNPPEDLLYNTLYYWNIVVWDNHGSSTTGPLWHFTTIEQNYPPDAPLINGPSTGKPGETYTYTFVAVDPNDDNVYYEINWGDGQVDDWHGPCGSDVVITRTHTWEEKGTYIIQARAKDIYDATGPWGTLSVTMPMDLRSAQSQVISLPQLIKNGFINLMK